MEEATLIVKFTIYSFPKTQQVPSPTLFHHDLWPSGSGLDQSFQAGQTYGATHLLQRLLSAEAQDRRGRGAKRWAPQALAVAARHALHAMRGSQYGAPGRNGATKLSAWQRISWPFLNQRWLYMNLYDLYGSIWDIISDRVTRVKSRGSFWTNAEYDWGHCWGLSFEKGCKWINTWLWLVTAGSSCSTVSMFVWFPVSLPGSIRLETDCCPLTPHTMHYRGSDCRSSITLIEVILQKKTLICSCSWCCVLPELAKLRSVQLDAIRSISNVHQGSWKVKHKLLLLWTCQDLA